MFKILGLSNHHFQKYRTTLCFAVLVMAVFFCCLITLTMGEIKFSLSQVVNFFIEPRVEDVSSKIFWQLRVPKMFAAVFSGIALSVSGLSLQTVFRNPLCGPFVLGISSGASLGVALLMLAGVSFGHFGILGGASLGALGVTMIIMLISSRYRQSFVLLVAGLLIGYFVDAIVSFLLFSSEKENLQVFVAWGLGSFGRLTIDSVILFFIPVVLGVFLILVSLRYLNVAYMGDDFAKSLGVRVKFARKCILLGSSILAGASTAFCGPIAFIGIAVPHLTYMFFKTTNHRILIPGCACFGSLLALVSGMVPQVIPLNAVLSIIGVPIILYVILRDGKNGGSL